MSGGILSRQAIESRIQSGDIKIEPAPVEEDYDSDAVDVHLGEKVYEWTKLPQGTAISLQLWQTDLQKFSYNKFSKEYLNDVPPDNAGIITLRPQTFYLADLRQKTTLPHDIAMLIQGKSSLARLGMLVHLTAPHAHAGWSGRLTLEIYNLGPFNIEMKPGMNIGQLSFWTVQNPADERDSISTNGQFDNQTSARGAPA